MRGWRASASWLFTTTTDKTKLNLENKIRDESPWDETLNSRSRLRRRFVLRKQLFLWCEVLLWVQKCGRPGQCFINGTEKFFGYYIFCFFFLFFLTTCAPRLICCVCCCVSQSSTELNTICPVTVLTCRYLHICVSAWWQMVVYTGKYPLAGLHQVMTDIMEPKGCLRISVSTSIISISSDKLTHSLSAQ